MRGRRSSCVVGYKVVCSRLERSAMQCTSGLDRRPISKYSCYRTEDSADCTCRIADVFRSEGLKTRKQRPSHLTPPYVTAEPVVTHRPLVSPNGDKLRFVILATDGRE